MTSEDVRSVTFEQTRKGYRPDDVDDYLLQVANEMERLEQERNAAIADRDAYLAERDAAVAAKEDAETKMYVLASKVEEYRGQEDTLKTALINAQRMGETVVHEAKQKAEQIVRDATGQSELLRQRAEEESERERRTLEKLQNEVKTFKTTILNLYKQHIESLSALDPPMARADDVLENNKPNADAGAEVKSGTEAAVAEIETASVQVEIPPLAHNGDAPEPATEMPLAEEATELPEQPVPSLFEGELIED